MYSLLRINRWLPYLRQLDTMGENIEEYNVMVLYKGTTGTSF